MFTTNNNNNKVIASECIQACHAMFPSESECNKANAYTC